MARPAAPTQPEGVAGDRQIQWDWARGGVGDVQYWQYQLKEGSKAWSSWTNLDGSDRVYAFRKDASDSKINMYASSQAGWQEVDLGKRVHFSGGAGTPPPAQVVVTGGTSMATATVLRVVRTSGEWTDGSAVGFMLIKEGTGTLAAADALTWTGQTSGTDTMTLSAAPVAQKIEWQPGASLRFINHNFYGQSSGERMYAVTGVGNAFEFDGELFTPIFTGVADDRPILIEEHQEHLFLGYRHGSVIHSALGDPINYEDVEGASEIATGQQLTNLISGYRDSLFIYGQNQTGVLQGTSVADWHYAVVSDEAGGFIDTAQILTEPYVYDDRGIRGAQATDRFGDFEIATASANIRPLLDEKRKNGVKTTVSTRVRSKSQYRLWFDDGDCIVMAYLQGSQGAYLGFSITRYETITKSGESLTINPNIVNHVCSVESRDGRERIFATFQGSAYVYELERGINFDGDPLYAIMQMPFNDMGHPAMMKKYRKCIIECDAVDPSKFEISADYDDGGAIEERTSFEFSAESRGVEWGVDEWEQLEWSQEGKNLAHARLFGRGRNIAPVIYSRGDDIPPHVISGVTVLFMPLKTQR